MCEWTTLSFTIFAWKSMRGDVIATPFNCAYTRWQVISSKTKKRKLRTAHYSPNEKLMHRRYFVIHICIIAFSILMIAIFTLKKIGHAWEPLGVNLRSKVWKTNKNGYIRSIFISIKLFSRKVLLYIFIFESFFATKLVCQVFFIWYWFN